MISLLYSVHVCGRPCDLHPSTKFTDGRIVRLFIPLQVYWLTLVCLHPSTRRWGSDDGHDLLRAVHRSPYNTVLYASRQPANLSKDASFFPCFAPLQVRVRWFY